MAAVEKMKMKIFWGKVENGKIRKLLQELDKGLKIASFWVKTLKNCTFEKKIA